VEIYADSFFSLINHLPIKQKLGTSEKPLYGTRFNEMTKKRWKKK
jgi:hypothetical protein